MYSVPYFPVSFLGFTPYGFSQQGRGGRRGYRSEGTGHREEPEDDGERVRAGGMQRRISPTRSFSAKAGTRAPLGGATYVTIQALDAKSFDSYLRSGGIIAIQSTLRRRAMEGHA